MNRDQQLGFDALLQTADADNEARLRNSKYGHLPETLDEAAPYLQNLIERHHAAMLAADGDLVAQLRADAHDLAEKLNGYEAGILANDDAPGRVLDRLTAASRGMAPLWGQSGSFEVVYGKMRVAVEMDGLFGIGARFMVWPGFAAHALDWDKPFLSETGYRSFLGVGGALEPGLTPCGFAERMIAAYVKKALKGKLVLIEQRYRQSP